jgi:hypothetical protein
LGERTQKYVAERNEMLNKKEATTEALEISQKQQGQNDEKQNTQQCNDGRNALVQTGKDTKEAMTATERQRKEDEECSNISLVRPDYSKLDPIAKLLFDVGSGNEKAVEVALTNLADLCYCSVELIGSFFVRSIERCLLVPDESSEFILYFNIRNHG